LPVGLVLRADQGQQRDAFAHQREHFAGEPSPCGLHGAEAIDDDQIRSLMQRFAQHAAGLGKRAGVEGAGMRAGAECLGDGKAATVTYIADQHR